MTANPDRPETPAAPPLAMGVAITGVIAFAVIGWIVLGAHVLKEPSYYTAFVLFWYWTTVERSDFKRLPASLIGALVGLGCTWALKAATGVWGWWGVGYGGVLIALAVFLDVMRWAPLAFNGCTTLFLTVAGIPLVATPTNFSEAAGSLLVGSACLSVVAWLAIHAPRHLGSRRVAPGKTRLTSAEG